MAKTSMKLKQQREQKFSTREYNRCKICGRPHAYLRKFGICWYCRVSWPQALIPVLRKQAGEKLYRRLINHADYRYNR